LPRLPHLVVNRTARLALLITVLAVAGGVVGSVSVALLTGIWTAIWPDVGIGRADFVLAGVMGVVCAFAGPIIAFAFYRNAPLSHVILAPALGLVLGCAAGIGLMTLLR